MCDDLNEIRGNASQDYLDRMMAMFGGRAETGNGNAAQYAIAYGLMAIAQEISVLSFELGRATDIASGSDLEVTPNGQAALSNER